MPAFATKSANIIENTIRNIFGRAQKFFECELKHDDIKRMVLKSDDIEVLERAYNIMYPPTAGYGTHNIKIRLPWKDVATGIQVSLHSSSGFRFLIPHYVDDQNLTPPPCNTRDKIEAWVTERLNHGVEWGRVVEVFRYLQERCTTPQQLRFYFPGIVTLLVNSDDAKLVQMGSKLRSARTPTEFISLNREAKDYIAAANATLATAQLFLQSPQPHTPDCRAALYSVTGYVNVRCPLDGTRQVVL